MNPGNQTGTVGPRGLADAARMPRKAPPSRPQQLLELACRVARADRGGLGLFSVRGEVAEHFLHDAAGSAPNGDPDGLKGLLQFLARRSEPILLPTTPGDPTRGPFLGVPLFWAGRCRGALYLSRNPDHPPFTPEELEAVLPVASWLEQGNLFEESRLLARLRLMNQVARATAGSFDLARILSVALHELDRLLPRHAGAVWLIDPPASGSNHDATDLVNAPPENVAASLVLAQRNALDPLPPAPGTPAADPLPPGFRLALAGSPFAAALERGEAFYADLSPSVRSPWSVGKDEDEHPTDKEDIDTVLYSSRSTVHGPEVAERPLRVGINGAGGADQRLLTLGEAEATCCFAVPLRAGDRAVGLLQSVCLRPSGFTSEQVQLLYLVADLLGPAVSHCQLFDRLRNAYEALRVTQTHLVQSEKMRALGELAGGMAHEFNNSLCGVLGFLELSLLHNDLNPAMRKQLESARRCALDAAQTVSRVQDFSRWQQKNRSLAAVDLNEMVRQSVELIRHKSETLASARGKPIHLELQLQESPVWVDGNATELREVLMNLAFNAVDAMTMEEADRRPVKRASAQGLYSPPMDERPRHTGRARGGTLTVRTRVANGKAQLAVSDTGVGIPEEIRKRLFEPFFTTKGERGNGLGLSVVFGIVQRHGGTIQVESAVGQGATFLVDLPLGQPDDVGAARAMAPLPVFPPAPPEPGQGLRVLVVDDEQAIGEFLAAALRELGHQPHVCSDARQGLAAFRRQPFDVVLTDLGLPEVSGEELAGQIGGEAPDTPIILLTGWAEQLEALNEPMEHVDCILSKPVSLTTLADTLKAVMSPAS